LIEEVILRSTMSHDTANQHQQIPESTHKIVMARQENCDLREMASL